ncbi:MAG: acyl-[ACP]--phospholipid O-acyltransferase, partial [Planctomycetota bacterium]
MAENKIGNSKLAIENKLSRSFDWHNATQFLGALNDNVFQGLMIFFLIGTLGTDRKADINAMAAIIFVVPFLLFTPFAGSLADWFSKRQIIVMAKAVELGVMVAGCVIFYFNFTVGIYAALFLMCTQSAFFGPCKYGIIPELVHKDQISRANSFMEGMTYLAIVIGAALGPVLAKGTGRNFEVAGLFCIAFAAAGLFTSTRIEKTKPIGEKSKISVFFIRDVWATLRRVRHDRDMILAVFASAYFMLIGGFAKINLIPYGMETCGYSDIDSGFLFVIAALGIGAGSYLAGRLSGRNVELGIVPLGAVGMAVTAICLGAVSPVADGAVCTFRSDPRWGVFTLVFLMGISCGLFIVPIHSFIQLRAPEKIRGRVLAASSFLGWIGVFLAALLVKFVCGTLGVDSRWMFLTLGILTLVLAVVTVWRLPDFLVRLILVLLTRTIYRIRTRGEENVPTEGPALIVSNHVSWADAVVLMATQQRRIRFVMDREISQNRWVGWVFRLGQIIPISATDPPKKIVAALREARQAMDDGYLVCIFAEGTLTRTGLLNKFRGGFERIVKGTDYPIIPTYIGGLWGSILSHYHGKLLGALPRKLPYPVGVHFGEPMAADSDSQRIREAIEELSVDFYDAKKPKRLSLGETFIKSARKHWAKPCLSDTMGKRLSFGKSLIASAALADKLRIRTVGQQNVGIFLPSSVGGALANLAMALLNKTAVNLSYVASVEDRACMIETARIRTVLTSRTFLEKLNLDRKTLPGAIFIEDIVSSVTPTQKRQALLRALFMPRAKLAHR